MKLVIHKMNVYLVKMDMILLMKINYVYHPQDIQSKKYYLDNDNNYYYLCSYSLAHCSTCDNKIKCLTCINNDYVIEINDKCIDKDLVTQNYYYLNEENNKYVSCSEIVGCEKCISSTECISCQKGFNFNNDNLCKKESSDSKITSAQICGIVIGCVGLGLIFAVIFLLISKKKRNNIKKLDIIITKYEENKNVDNPNIINGINKSSEDIVKTEEKK